VHGVITANLKISCSIILRRLNDTYLIFAAFGLNRDHVMATVLVEADV